MALAIGIDVGGTKIAAGLVNDSGEIVSEATVPTPKEGADAVVSAIEIVMNSVCSEARIDLLGDAVTGVGLGVPGLIDRKADLVRFLPNLPGIVDFPIRRLIQDSSGKPVEMDNDANLAALGEARYGAAAGHSNVVMLTVGTGLGGGILVDGKLLHGETGAAGEIGHMVIDLEGPVCVCGNHGCIESLVAGPAILKRAQAYLAELDGTPIASASTSVMWEASGGVAAALTPPMITDAALAGDSLALRVYREAGEALGAGIASLVNIFNPSVVVVGGGVAERAGDIILGPAIEEARARALSANIEATTIVAAQLGNKAGIVGAAASAFEA